MLINEPQRSLGVAPLHGSVELDLFVGQAVAKDDVWHSRFQNETPPGGFGWPAFGRLFGRFISAVPARRATLCIVASASSVTKPRSKEIRAEVLSLSCRLPANPKPALELFDKPPAVSLFNIHLGCRSPAKCLDLLGAWLECACFCQIYRC